MTVLYSRAPTPIFPHCRPPWLHAQDKERIWSPQGSAITNNEAGCPRLKSCNAPLPHVRIVLTFTRGYNPITTTDCRNRDIAGTEIGDLLASKLIPIPWVYFLPV